MEKFKQILTKLLFPHIAVVIILVPLSVVMLIYAFAVESADRIIVYGSYFLSAYALTILCTRSPAIFRKVKSLKTENRYINRYMTDVHLRMEISLYGTVAMNTLYALMQLASGFHFRSVWFYALAGYYILLAVMRFFLLRDTKRSTPGEDKLAEFHRYRFCGMLLLLMNLTLAVIVFFIVRQNRGFQYHYIHTIAMAAYTFAAMTMAVINVVKYRRYESPVMSAAKAISLASALVSMLSLETAMLTAFGEGDDPVFRQIMTASTGAAVCLFVLGMAIYMIIRSTKEIKQIKKESV